MQTSGNNPFGDVMKWAGISALTVVGVGVFLFSASNNFILFLGIFGQEFGGYVLSVLGLTILDIAAVGWVVYGVSAARGVFQRVVSWLTGAVCLCLALAAAVSELVIKQEYTARPEWIGTLAIASIIIGLIVNAISITLTHIIDPGTLLNIKVGMQKDVLRANLANQHIETLTLATQKAHSLMQQNSDRLATTLSTEMYRDAERELLGYTPGGDSSQLKVLQGPATPAMAAGGGKTDDEFDQRARPSATPYRRPDAVRTTYRPMNVGSPTHVTPPPPPPGMNPKHGDEESWLEDDEVDVKPAPIAQENAPKVTAPMYHLGQNGKTRVVYPNSPRRTVE